MYPESKILSGARLTVEQRNLVANATWNGNVWVVAAVERETVDALIAALLVKLVGGQLRLTSTGHRVRHQTRRGRFNTRGLQDHDATSE